MGSLYVGIDLSESTGLVALDDEGALVARGTADTDDEIAAWLEALPGGVAVAAVDAPLQVADGVDPSRAGALAERLGWTTAATNRGSVSWPACIHVDPEGDLATLPPELAAIDDAPVAVRCAHLAWLWHERPGALRVYGDRELGYVVAPPPPPAGAALHVEVDSAELDAVRAAIEAIPGVHAVHAVAPGRARADDEVG